MAKKLIVAVLVLLALGFLSISVRADQPSPGFAPGQVLVRTGNGPILGWEVREVSAGNERAEVARLRALGQDAEVNGLWSIVETIPNDERWWLQYGPLRIKGPQAWDISTGNSSVVIAIIDTGVRCTHEDLLGKCLAGYDFVNGDADADDDHGHGSHVAGIAAATTNNNGIGMAGICWLCKIQPVKVLAQSGFGTWEDVALGILWAADHDADIINMSLGGTSYSQVVQDAVAYAYDSGVIVFAAAGNTGGEGVLYPAKYAQVIAIAATDQNDNRAGFSTTGPEVELSAPGIGIESVWWPGNPSNGGYASLSGTSMATPHAAGTGALLLSLRPELTNLEVRETLQLTAVDRGDVGRDNLYGFGLVDAYAALLFNGEIPTPVPTLVPTREPGTVVCGKYTGGVTWNQNGSPYILTCNVDIKGGLTAINATVELRGFALGANGVFFKNVTMNP
jgi:subtilisin family serine protease